MFFSSAGKKEIVANSENLFKQIYKGFIEEEWEGDYYESFSLHNASKKAKNDENKRKFAILIYCGWLHFAIMFFVQKGELKNSEINSVLMHNIKMVRKYFPVLPLHFTYLEDTLHMARHAFTEANIHPLNWIPAYCESCNQKFGLPLEYVGTLTAVIVKFLSSHDLQVNS